jgi:hypothetical protein
MITCVWGIYWEKSAREGAVGGQHQWGMTPRPIKQFIWVVSRDAGTCYIGGSRRMKKGKKRIKTEIEINGYGIVDTSENYFLK